MANPIRPELAKLAANIEQVIMGKHEVVKLEDLPQEIRAPSKAGPAAAEAQWRRSRAPTTISPFVPRS